MGIYFNVDIIFYYEVKYNNTVLIYISAVINKIFLVYDNNELQWLIVVSYKHNMWEKLYKNW